MESLTSRRGREVGLCSPSLVTLSVAAISHFATPSASAAALTWSGNDNTWTAVPEPTSALAGILLGAGLLRRRRA